MRVTITTVIFVMALKSMSQAMVKTAAEKNSSRLRRSSGQILEKTVVDIGEQLCRMFKSSSRAARSQFQFGERLFEDICRHEFYGVPL